MKLALKVILVLLMCKVYSQTAYKFHRAPGQCEEKVKVIDVKPTNCNIPGATVLYPVIDEQFNFKEDLPNNWGFNMNYTKDSDYDQNNSYPFIWSGPDTSAYLNNLEVINGKCILLLKKEKRLQKEPWSGSALKNYDFTFADLRSLFKVKGGVFKSTMKLPENNLIWPAFWLREGISEIDIFEFYDGEVDTDICDIYHSMRMGVGNKILNNNNNIQCNRNRKFTVPSYFFDHANTFQLNWSDYRYDIHLNNNLVGYATKYYDSPFTLSGGCYTGPGTPLAPVNTFYCNQLINLQNCNLLNPVTNNCVVYNKIRKDKAFIGADTVMDLIISMSIFGEDNNTKLINSWNNYTDVNKRIEVDRVTVWQPVNCNVPRLVCSKQEFYNQTGGTSFLSGSKITIKACNSTNFNIYPGTEVTNFENYHLLATEEIELQDEIFINEGAFFRAEIIDCHYALNMSANQKTNSNDGPPTYTEVDEELLSNMESQELDSLMKANGLIYEDGNDLNGFYKRGLLKSQVDNGSILLFPSPTADYLNIEMDEEDYNDILSLEIIDALGRYEKIDVNSKISVKHLKPGMYQLRFVFTHGFIVVKSFLKTE